MTVLASRFGAFVAERHPLALAEALVEAHAEGCRRFTYELSPFSSARAVTEIEQFYTSVIANKARGMP